MGRGERVAETACVKGIVRSLLKVTVLLIVDSFRIYVFAL